MTSATMGVESGGRLLKIQSMKIEDKSHNEQNPKVVTPPKKDLKEEEKNSQIDEEEKEY